MKRFRVCMMVVMISLGVVAVMGGCGGGGGGGGGLTKSSPSYAGPNAPAVMDTTNVMDFAELPWMLDMIVGDLVYDGTYTESGSQEETVDGSVSGTVKYLESGTYSESDTKESYSSMYREEYNNYADSGDNYHGILAGSGSAEWREEGENTYNDVGDWISEWDKYYVNFSSYYFSTSTSEQERSGWVTQEENYDYEADNWNVVMGANIAYNDLVNDFYEGLLDAGANLAWDGSFTVLNGKGGLCVEGEGPDGCVDFKFTDMTWDVDGDGRIPDALPISGTMDLSTSEASAMFAYGTSGGDCIDISLDADNSGDYADSTGDLDAERFCP